MSDSEAGLINDDAVGVGYVPPPPAPTVTSIDPASAPPGTAFTLHVHGSGFTESAQVRVGGNRSATTFVSDTELTVDVDALRTQGIDVGQVLDVWVDNAPGQTNTVGFTFGDAAPAPSGPVISSIVPDTEVAGTPGVEISVFGDHFAEDAVIWFRGVAVGTNYENTGLVSTVVNIPATAGPVSCQVIDSGGTSNTVNFTVTASQGDPE